MEVILHGLGICSDNHSHLDLIDVILFSVGGGASFITIKCYYKTVLFIIREQYLKLFK